VIFAATTARQRLEHTASAHQQLHDWLGGRPLIYQFDDTNDDSLERLTPAGMAERLAIGDRTWFSTRAVEGHGLRLMFREMVARLVRGGHPERPLPAPIETLQP
jgi:hypothetical protein